MLIKIKTIPLINIYLQSIPKQSLSITQKGFLKHHCKSPAANGLNVANHQKIGTTPITLGELIEKAFKRFFQSDALAFNK